MIEIIYESEHKPYGIKGEEGFILFFPEITRHEYRGKCFEMALREQRNLAEFLKEKLIESDYEGE